MFLRLQFSILSCDRVYVLVRNHISIYKYLFVFCRLKHGWKSSKCLVKKLLQVLICSLQCRSWQLSGRHHHLHRLTCSCSLIEANMKCERDLTCVLELLMWECLSMGKSQHCFLTNGDCFGKCCLKAPVCRKVDLWVWFPTFHSCKSTVFD